MSLANSRLQVDTSTVATRDIALSLEDVGEVNRSKRLLGPLTHGSVYRMFQIGVEVQSVSIAAGRLVSRIKSALQPLVHESV